MVKNRSFSRILVKLSGEGLMGPKEFGLHLETIEQICDQIKIVYDHGIQVCLVVGAGNIFRGLSDSELEIDRNSADYMGMLGTVINALALQSILRRKSVPAFTFSAIPMSPICASYDRKSALQYLEENHVIIFSAGTGNPYFTTDTAATLRALEMECDAIFKGTLVDGVYNADPRKDPLAKKFNTLTYKDVLTKDSRIMDASAVALAKDNSIPIIVFPVLQCDGLLNVINGEGSFTIISD